MVKYTIRRLLIMIPIILGVAVLIFTIMYFTPGDPARTILGASASEEELAVMRDYLGLNQPYIVRLGKFLSDTFLHFDLGTSLISNQSVAAEIGIRFPRTVFLSLFVMVVGTLIGIPLGVTAAVHQDGWADRFCMIFSMAFTCIPDFWLALMLIIVFSLRLNWFPSYGIGGIEYYILPCISLVFGSFARLARHTRSSMLEVIRSDFATTAKASGYSEHDVIWKHVLPNAMIPVITQLGQEFAGRLGGTIIIEAVFSMPGIGLYMSTAVSQRDYPVVQGCVVFLAILFCLIMLGVDLAYAAFDPRIKAQYVNGGKRGR